MLSLSNFQVDLYKFEFGNHPSPDTGQSVTTPVASAAAPLTLWGGPRALLFHLRGSSERFSVAVSKCVFASR